MPNASPEMFNDALEAVERLRKSRGFDNAEAQQLYMSLLQFNGCLQTGSIIGSAELCETAGIEMGRRLREIAEKGKNAAALEAGGTQLAPSPIVLPREPQPIKMMPPVDIIVPH